MGKSPHDPNKPRRKRGFFVAAIRPQPYRPRRKCRRPAIPPSSKAGAGGAWLENAERMDFLREVQMVAGAVITVGGAWATVRKGLPWVRQRWANRYSAVVRRSLERLEQQGNEAARERTSHGQKLDRMGKDVVILGATMRAVVASDPTIATTEFGPDGLLRDANRTFLHWTGRTFAELERWGWLNSVADEYRQKVRSEWESAVRDVRSLVIGFDLLAVDSSRIPVRATLTPIPEGIIPCEKFVGVIHRLEG